MNKTTHVLYMSITQLQGGQSMLATYMQRFNKAH